VQYSWLMLRLDLEYYYYLAATYNLIILCQKLKPISGEYIYDNSMYHMETVVRQMSKKKNIEARSLPCRSGKR